MHNTHQAIDLPSLRKQKILLLLERDGKVTASELVEHFAVSQDTIRRDLAESIEANTVHGSDSDENAAIEIAFFFKPEEIVG